MLEERVFTGTQLTPEGLETGIGLRIAHAGLQPRDDGQPGRLVILEIVEGDAPGNGLLDHRDGNKDARLVPADRRVEVALRDTHNGKRVAIDENGLPDYIPR